MKISPKQRRVLEAIEELTHEHGQAPSYRELASHLGYQSTASIYRFIIGLEKKGLVERSKHSWRSIEKRPSSNTNESEIELIGSISRQRPPELFAQTSRIVIPQHFCQEHETLYGFRVQDSSLVDEHLLPGDLLIVEPTDEPAPGELALTSTEETIVGYFFDEGASIRLHSSPYSARKSLSSRVLAKEDLQIWGVIIGLVRSFTSNA